MDKPQLVSSSSTIFLKFALPVCWIMFFGLFTAALWIVDTGPILGLSQPVFRAIFSFFFVLGVWVLYWMVMDLKRVEMDTQFVYVTNYFKNVRYPFHSIERLEEKDYLLFKSMVIYFREAGYFGEKVTFIPGRTNFGQFMETHPEVKKKLKID